ncbi:MAG: DUF1934 domain-containing protein [Clostridia bacterium]|nr:DUF1934 domain-containing protein [Clostridia bacterium]
MKKVLIKVKGVQGIDGDNTVIELVTEGTLRRFENEYTITYTEEQTVEGSKTKTVLTVQSDNTVVLERRGDLNSRLVITKGERNNCLYAMPQGTLSLGIYGKEVKSNLTESGGTVKMAYTIDANLEPISENTVEIFVEER